MKTLIQGQDRITKGSSLDIAIIGSGVIGLSTGILLRQLGYRVTIYTSELPPVTHSDTACAIWLPFFVGDPTKLTDNDVALSTKWAQLSWQAFESLVDSKYGVYWTTNYEMFPGPEPDPYFANIFSDFDSGVDLSLPAGLTYKWVFRTFLIESPKYMAALLQEYKWSRGNIKIQQFSSIDQVLELAEPIIFNCSALGASLLFGDKDIRPVKGQLILHEPRDLGYSLGYGEYGVIPRKDALVLGSLLEEDFDTPMPTEEGTERLWRTITSWLSPTEGIFDSRRLNLSREKIQKVVAGLRPYRPNGIRLEAERIGSKFIIHDYGHGGAGFTFSWGCALESIGLMQHFEGQA